MKEARQTYSLIYFFCELRAAGSLSFYGFICIMTSISSHFTKGNGLSCLEPPQSASITPSLKQPSLLKIITPSEKKCLVRSSGELSSRADGLAIG